MLVSVRNLAALVSTINVPKREPSPVYSSLWSNIPETLRKAVSIFPDTCSSPLDNQADSFETLTCGKSVYFQARLREPDKCCRFVKPRIRTHICTSFLFLFLNDKKSSLFTHNRPYFALFFLLLHKTAFIAYIHSGIFFHKFLFSQLFLKTSFLGFFTFIFSPFFIYSILSYGSYSAILGLFPLLNSIPRCPLSSTFVLYSFLSFHISLPVHPPNSILFFPFLDKLVCQY